MVPVRKPGRPLSLCACPNRPPNCSCGGGGVKVAIPRKQQCGCGPGHGNSAEDHSSTAAAQGIPSPRFHASSSTPARPAFRVSKSGSISKPHVRYQLPTFDLDLATLGLAAQHNAAFGPNMTGVSAGELMTSVNPTVQLPIGCQPGFNYEMGYPAVSVNDPPLNQQTFSSAPSVGHNGIAQSPPQGFKTENSALSEQMTVFATLQRQQMINRNGVTDATFMGSDSFPRQQVAHGQSVPVTQSSPSATLGDQSFTSEPLQWNKVKQDLDAKANETEGTGIESSPKKKSCCGGNRNSRGSQQHVNGSVTVSQSGYGQPSATPLQFNTKSPLELKQQQEPLPSPVMPFGYQTVFRYPEEYGSWNHPLDPQTYQQIAHQGAATAQASQQGADLTLDLFLSGGGGAGAGTSHECTCGPGCQCIGCVAHPYNTQTIQYVQDAYNFNIASPIGSPGGQNHRGSIDFAATAGVHQQQQQQYQISSPTLGPRNGQQQQPQQQLPPDSPVEAQTPSDASGTPSDEQYLSTADFLWATIPLPNCAGESLSCPCGDDCACIGCMIHGNAVPALACIGDGLEQQQAYDIGQNQQQHQQHQQVQSHCRSQSQGHEGMMPMPDGLPQGMMDSGPSSVIPLAHRGLGDMSGLNVPNGGGMSSDINSAMSSPRTPHTPRGIDGILRAAASGGDGVGNSGGGGCCCGGRGGGAGRSTEVSVP